MNQSVDGEFDDVFVAKHAKSGQHVQHRWMKKGSVELPIHVEIVKPDNRHIQIMDARPSYSVCCVEADAAQQGYPRETVRYGGQRSSKRSTLLWLFLQACLCFSRCASSTGS